MFDRVHDNDRTVRDNDIEFVELCQKGDTEAFSVLVERHQKRVLNIAYRMMGDYEDACDVAQEAFLSAYRSIKTFRRDSLFSTWLYRVVVNQAKNRLRQVKSRTRHERQAFDDPPESGDESHTCLIPSPESPLIEQMEKREIMERVQECIGALDGEYREVLVLRDIQGFSYDDIQSILKIPDGTVKSRLFRARVALKDCLVKVFGDL
jgi:RNA polymerase sigma-70 factor (ECF subfamily)